MERDESTSSYTSKSIWPIDGINTPMDKQISLFFLKTELQNLFIVVEQHNQIS